MTKMEKTYAHIARDPATKEPTIALIRTAADKHPVFYRLEALHEDEIAELSDIIQPKP
jgi:hypothetical protein